MRDIFNISHRKVGGIHFLRVGRFFFSFGLSRTCPLNPPADPVETQGWDLPDYNPHATR